MSNELALVPSNDDLKAMQTLAQVFMQSGALPTNKNIAELVLKIQAGSEIGIRPFAAVNGIDFINGQRSFRAALVASKVNDSGRYKYRIAESDDNKCVLNWFEKEDGKWEQIGTSSFTYEEAQQANLTGKTTWKNYRTDMLFSRALTRGCRRFCPNVFGGIGIYTREELEDIKVEVENNDDLSAVTYDEFVEKVKLEVNPTATKDVITNFLKDGGYSWKTSSKRDMFNYIAEKLKVEQPITDGEFETPDA